MPAFTDRFLAELEAQRPHFRAIFSPGVSSPAEEHLARRVAANWHPLPAYVSERGARPAQRPAAAPTGAGDGGAPGGLPGKAPGSVPGTTAPGGLPGNAPGSAPGATAPGGLPGNAPSSAPGTTAPGGLPGKAPTAAGEGGAPATFAIDGSEATRNFSNASWLVVCQALLLGPGVEHPSLQLRLVPGNVPSAVVDSYCSRLMRWLELRLALDHIGLLAGHTLTLDGSLYSALPHLLYPLERLYGQPGCSQDADLPIRVLEAYVDLFDACRRQDILLLGISKTTQDRVLTHTLAHLPDDLDRISVDMAEQAEGAEPSRIPPDAEALDRWTDGRPGCSTPVLLGLYSFGRFRETILSDPDRVAQSFAGLSRYSPARLLAILERLQRAPAIAAFHIRFAEGDDCIRVDVPADAIGCEDRLVDLSSGLAPIERLEPILRQLQGCYGGPAVYHAPLYAVDRQVRLSNDAVDGPFLSILRDAIRPDIRYNRSARRFL